MAGQYDRNRDDEGKFTREPRRRPQWQEDDNRYRESHGRENYDRENYGRGAEPPRDDRGRFLSEGENGDYYRGRDYDERDFGDSRGGRGNYGYEERNYSRGSGGMFGRGDYGRDEQQGRGRGRDEYGRFSGDDDYRRGRGDDYGDRGSRGREYGRGTSWYGDPQGHAEARERSQESRGSRYQSDDDRSGRGGGSFRGGGRERDESGRFVSDDERGRGGEDHRGWFGDPRGHSQAARLGWRHRQR